MATPSSLSGVARSQTSLLVRLIDIAMSPGQDLAARQPRRSIDSVNALIRPNCSMIGNETVGRHARRMMGCRQRASTSNLAIFPVRMSTIGWKYGWISSWATARRTSDSSAAFNSATSPIDAE